MIRKLTLTLTLLYATFNCTAYELSQVPRPLLYGSVIGLQGAIFYTIAGIYPLEINVPSKKQAQEVMAFYNKINIYAHSLIENNAGTPAAELLVRAEEDLQSFLEKIDYFLYWLELPIDGWVNRKKPDIVCQDISPFLQPNPRQSMLSRERVVVFNDITQFVLFRTVPFTLLALINHRIVRLRNNDGHYTDEQKRLLVSYFSMVAQVCSDHQWRLLKPRIKTGSGIFAAGVLIGALSSYYMRSQNNAPL